MLTDRELAAAVGGTAYGPDGEAIGTVRHFLADDRTGTHTWGVLGSGPDASGLAVVPVLDAVWTGGELRLPVTRAAAEGAPAVASVEHLDPGEEAALRRHYGLVKAGPADEGMADEGMADEGMAQGGRVSEGRVDERERIGGAQQAPDGAMTRSEERLRVRTERVPATRVRLVKYVVTEEVQVTVPVRREEVRLEEVPLDAPDPVPGESLAPEQEAAARDEARSGGLPEEIVLHREEPVVSVRVVPTERVRLRTDVVEGQERISGRLQREQIVLDEDAIR